MCKGYLATSSKDLHNHKQFSDPASDRKNGEYSEVYRHAVLSCWAVYLDTITGKMKGKWEREGDTQVDLHCPARPLVTAPA